ncbi:MULTISPECIES: sugar-binding domain-containing protein [unclassified Saccharicrinis]|uniref:sugar-binding domain-containing protein n=1 Tax=unclassified Saccharicrinis TaxID=2646859 RepID=UPI003D3575FA
MMRNIIVALVFFISCLGCTSTVETRRTEDFNFDWKFHYGDVKNGFKENIDESNWREVKLPHDWSVEHSFTQEKTGGATAFLPGGVGWYRKTFELPSSAKDKLVRIEFDGVYTNSEVWINEHYLGKRPFGYAPFSYDLSEHINFGKENVIVVKADRTAFLDSRWYPGSGIYRNVKLVIANKTHIPQWGVFVTTPKVTKEYADVNISTDLKIESTEGNIVLKNTIYFNEAQVASEEEKLDLTFNGEAKSNVAYTVRVDNPQLWDTETPNLYTAVTELIVDGKVVDNTETKFGIRSFYFDAEKGFFLNGKNTLIKGVCLHHDGGLVGAAVPRGVWERRLMKLKEAGCNAIRTAHNPPSEEFLDICDEIGFLVQDEAFDEFQKPKDKRKNYNQQSVDEETKGYAQYFDEWCERDLTNMILRDRNHPSIIMWSIGNEIEWTFPNYGQATGYWGSTKVGDVNYYWDEPPLSIEKVKELFYKSGKEDVCAQTARKLSRTIKKFDTTRPVTANLVIPAVSMFSGYADALDIVGLSYRQSVYDYCRKHYPDKVILGTENWVRYHEWKPVVENEYMSGIFMWTGINYMGESRRWPVRGSGSGMLDFAGFENPSYHMFKSLWNKVPHVYITTQTSDKSPYTLTKGGEVIEKEKDWSIHQKWGWQDVNTHWNYNEGEGVMVEIYTNQEAVELFLNDKSYGVRHLSDVDDHILKWFVPYHQGELKAVSASVQHSLKTALEPTDFLIHVDKDTLNANACDVAHFEIQLVDSKGIPVKHLEKEVAFKMNGPAKLLGVDNGSPNSIQDYQRNKVTTSEGRCLMILQALQKKGVAEIEIKIAGINKKTEIIIE